MSKEIYRHYFKDKDSHFSYKQFKPISNYLNAWNKPHGGLWACRLGVNYPWKTWLENGGYEYNKDWFDFHIKDDSNIICFKTLDNIRYLFKYNSKYIRRCSDSLYLERYLNCQNDSSVLPPLLILNFEAMVSDGIDAIDVEIKELDNIFFGWDCDSTLIMNPDVIIPIANN